MSLIPFDDREGFIWFNNKIIPWRDAKIHILNHGLHYASSVFEGERAYDGKIFKAIEHSQRLHNSAEALDFTIPYSIDELEKAKQATLEKNNIKDGYVRAFAFRGCEKLTIAAQETCIHTAIACWTWPPYYTDEGKKNGIKATFARYKRPHPATAPVNAKASGLYMICTISKHEAERKGFSEAIMLDYQGYLAEATSANMFLVINDELHTPKADRFLNGITRQTVIELAKKRNFKVKERRIKPEELHKATDVFLTGTAAEITRVQSIDNFKFSPHKITMQLIEDYKKVTLEK